MKGKHSKTSSISKSICLYINLKLVHASNSIRMYSYKFVNMDSLILRNRYSRVISRGVGAMQWIAANTNVSCKESGLHIPKALYGGIL